MKTLNVLFNDALKTFYLHLYGVGHIVKDTGTGFKLNGRPIAPGDWKRRRATENPQ